MEQLKQGCSLDGRLMSAGGAVKSRGGQALLVLGPRRRANGGVLLCICKPCSGVPLTGGQKDCLAAAGMRERTTDGSSPSYGDREVASPHRKGRGRRGAAPSLVQSRLQMVACQSDGTNWLPPGAGAACTGTIASNSVSSRSFSSSLLRSSSTSSVSNIEVVQSPAKSQAEGSVSASDDDNLLAICKYSLGA